MTQKEKYDYDVKSFYYVTLIDLVSGVSFQEIYDQLREFEMLENYEACDGIAKAIKFSQDKSILAIKKEISELEININTKDEIDA